MKLKEMMAPQENIFEAMRQATLFEREVAEYVIEIEADYPSPAAVALGLCKLAASYAYHLSDGEKDILSLISAVIEEEFENLRLLDEPSIKPDQIH